MGMFEKGMMSGHGTLKKTNGDICKAYWVDDEMTGTGIYTWDNGIKARVIINRGRMNY